MCQQYTKRNVVFFVSLHIIQGVFTLIAQTINYMVEASTAGKVKTATIRFRAEMTKMTISMSN